MSESRFIRVTASGYAGSYYQPPEPTELLIYCGECKDETDASTNDLWTGDVLVGCADGHEVTIHIEGGPDPDDELDRMRDEQWEDR